MRCTACGTENPDRAKLCIECTARLSESPAETAPAAAVSLETVDVSRASARRFHPDGRTEAK